MKKNLKLYVFAGIVCAVSVLNVTIMLNTERASDTSMTSLAAIGEGEPGENDEKIESNNKGKGKYFYKHLQGAPKECTLYKYIKGDTILTLGERCKELKEMGYIETRTTGIVELCPNKGNGCTAYSCREPNNK